jgi:hypothetical protein
MSQGVLFDPASRLVTKRGGLDVIRSAPMRFASTWTPTNDYDIATKEYADTHGGSAPQEQVNMIYYSKAGPKEGVTADGLTLDSAFGDLAAAIAAANAAAGVNAPYVVSCSDADVVTLTEEITVASYVSLCAPNMSLVFTGDMTGFSFAGTSSVSVYDYNGYVLSEVSSANVNIACNRGFRGNVSISADSCFLSLRCETFNAIVNPGGPDSLVNIDCATTMTMNLIMTNDSLVFAHAGVFIFGDSSISGHGILSVTANIIDHTTVENLIVDNSIVMLRASNLFTSSGMGWITETNNASVYLGYPVTYDTTQMEFTLEGSAPSQTVTVDMLVYKTSSFSYMHFGSIFILDQHSGTHLVSADAIPSRFLAQDVVNSTANILGHDNHSAVMSTATVDHGTGIVTIRPRGGGNYSGTSNLFVPDFCIMTWIN